MPDWINACLLGLIEGITEFLPISSTGHLLLAEQWLPRKSDLFNVVIQTGAALAVMVFFLDRVKQLCLRWNEPETRDYALKLGAAFGITCVGGLILKLLHFELPEKAAPVAIALIIGGLLFLMVERSIRHRALGTVVTWRIAAAIGSSQLLAAVFPGTSRSGATILIALLLGLDRKSATEFSFLLGIPTLLSAAALQIAESAHKGELGSVPWGPLAAATLVAAITAFVAVKWLLQFVQSHTFVGFAWYRILLGVLVLIAIGS